MVAVINIGRSLRNALNYNEQKLKLNKAELIHSMNYGKDTGELGFTDKIKRLEMLTRLNEKTELNSVHISLNFDPSEKLSNEKLQAIADSYMEKIGFGNQPYLVYKHNDAGHPHIHLLTTNIRADGSRIKMHNIGRNQSEKARKEIECDFQLVKAQKQQLKQVYELKPLNVSKVIYGKSETKRAITNVLDAILPVYKYASLPELNAVLRQYNVVADRGSEDSRTFKNNGLVYRVLDEKGEKVGSPVRSSAIYNKPTLKFLEDRFITNLNDKQVHKLRLKSAIDHNFQRQKGMSIPDLIKSLQKEQIQVVLRENKQKIIYGITYVDHRTKCVFNGSELGKVYSANGLQLRSRADQDQVQTPGKKINQQTQAGPIQNNMEFPGKLAEILLSEQRDNSMPYELRENIRRKKKRQRLRQ
ncbi:MAG: relaxase/mobilization nuclease domain-containing protein [Puia sp.]